MKNLNQAAMLRRCLDCSMETTPAGMGKHLKHSGHSGYQDVGSLN